MGNRRILFFLHGKISASRGAGAPALAPVVLSGGIIAGLSGGRCTKAAPACRVGCGRRRTGAEVSSRVRHTVVCSPRANPGRCHVVLPARLFGWAANEAARQGNIAFAKIEETVSESRFRHIQDVSRLPVGRDLKTAVPRRGAELALEIALVARRAASRPRFCDICLAEDGGKNAVYHQRTRPCSGKSCRDHRQPPPMAKPSGNDPPWRHRRPRKSHAGRAFGQVPECILRAVC